MIAHLPKANPEVVTFYVVAYKKYGETHFCKTPMRESDARKLVEILEMAGNQAKACSVKLHGGSFEELPIEWEQELTAAIP